MDGSYNLKTFSTSTVSEISRLKSQVNLFWQKEIKKYINYGLKDGMNILEIGSGPGFLTEKLLIEFPNIGITCVEKDNSLVSFAQENLSKKKNWRIIHESIETTSLEQDHYHFAIIRLLLEHLPEPETIVQKIYRTLEHGGIAVFIDNDFENHLKTYPHIPQLRKLYDAYCQSRFKEGGNPLIGRELSIFLKNAGFRKIDYEVISANSMILGDDIFLKSEGLGIPIRLFKDGYLSAKDVGDITKAWKEMINAENHVIIRQLSMAAGVK